MISANSNEIHEFMIEEGDSLQKIFINKNQISEISHLFSIRSLKELYATSNLIETLINGEICQTDIETIDIRQNPICQISNKELATNFLESFPNLSYFNG